MHVRSEPPKGSSEYKEQSFAWLERACPARDARLHRFKVDPRFDSLRSDLRFADLLNRVGLPPSSWPAPESCISEMAKNRNNR